MIILDRSRRPSNYWFWSGVAVVGLFSIKHSKPLRQEGKGCMYTGVFVLEFCCFLFLLVYWLRLGLALGFVFIFLSLDSCLFHEDNLLW
jgi:hypothetical protein